MFILEMFLALVILFYIVLLCAYVWVCVCVWECSLSSLAFPAHCLMYIVFNLYWNIDERNK